ncbi:MAG: ribonuclease HI, partial [Desulfobacterales bacterium]|nr:ribonuclease HI [Desulfobacterales bacterium]
METDNPEWKRMRFKKNKVWVAVDATGDPAEQNDKVLIKYQLDQPHEYWVRKSNIKPLDTKPVKTQRSEKNTAARKPGGREEICIFSDGASSGNPGPSGIGVVLRFGEHEKEISEYIGMATNNIAELKAIQAGLQALKNTDLPVRIFTDSNYAYGVLALGWKVRANREMVESIKKTMAKFKNLKIVKVKGHSGDEGNERADFLATSAIKH